MRHLYRVPAMKMHAVGSAYQRTAVPAAPARVAAQPPDPTPRRFTPNAGADYTSLVRKTEVSFRPRAAPATCAPCVLHAGNGGEGVNTCAVAQGLAAPAKQLILWKIAVLAWCHNRRPNVLIGSEVSDVPNYQTT